MKWIDTHSHIYQEDFDADIEQIIANARQHDIDKILLPNIDSDSISRMHQLCKKFPSECYPMMGLHPTSINLSYPDELKIIRKHLENHPYIAIGEIGIDLYWDKTYLKEQIIAFEEQLKWSVEFDIPVVIHNRESFPYIMDSLHKIGTDKLRGVFHSFGGTQDELRSILEIPSFLIGINGVITFKNSSLKDYITDAPLNRIVLETDAPYLAPVPYRGKRNEPVYMLKSAEKLAEIYNITLEELSGQTTENAVKLFGL